MGIQVITIYLAYKQAWFFAIAELSSSIIVRHCEEQNKLGVNS